MIDLSFCVCANTDRQKTTTQFCLLLVVVVGDSAFISFTLASFNHSTSISNPNTTTTPDDDDNKQQNTMMDPPPPPKGPPLPKGDSPPPPPPETTKPVVEDEDASLKQHKTKDDLLVTDLGTIEPLYDEFDGKMYGAYCLSIATTV